MAVQPLISIIIPVYKVESYLKKCIESVINQSYRNLQIILVDDGSPDNCGKICDEYCAKDSRIEVIHKPNGGLSDARNVGISKAKGEYIGFVDSDDYIEKSMFSDLYNLLIEHDADVSICNFYVVENDKLILKNKNADIKEYDKIEILQEILLDKNIQSYAWNKLYKRSLFENITYPLGKKYEDIGTTFYLLEKCNKVVVTGKPEYYYITREDSIVNNNSENTVIDYIDLIIQRYNYVQEKYAHEEQLQEEYIQNDDYAQEYTQDYTQGHIYNDLIKYNRYYLAKTLITAYTDICHLGNVGKECSAKVKELYNIVVEMMKKHASEIVDIFDDKQKEQLDYLLCDKKQLF